MFTGYSKAFYENIRQQALDSARSIVPLILGMTGAKSVVDVGCGEGTWLSVFQQEGVKRILGLDGEYVDQATLMFPSDCFRAVNLYPTPTVAERFDLAVSLEVAEHLPACAAAGFVTLLTTLAPVVMFSAAIPLQDGTRHINEQWQTHWCGLFRDQGFVACDAIRPAIWGSPAVAAWYRQNILVYVKESVLPTYPELSESRKRTDERMLALVHPDTYLRASNRPMGSPMRLGLWLPRLMALKLLRLWQNRG